MHDMQWKKNAKISKDLIDSISSKNGHWHHIFFASSLGSLENSKRKLRLKYIKWFA